VSFPDENRAVSRLWGLY